MDWKKWNWYKLGLIFALLLIFAATPTFASDYSGTVHYTSPVTTDSYVITGAGLNNPRHDLLKHIKIIDVGSYTNLACIYAEFNNASVIGANSVYHPGGGFSASTNVQVYFGSRYIGSGLFGYNDNLATGKTNVFLSFYDFDATGITGDQTFNLTGDATFTAHGLNDLEAYNFQTPTAEHGAMFSYLIFPTIDTEGMVGTYAVYSSYTFVYTWDMTTTGLSVTTNVQKLGNVSQAYIYRTDSDMIATEGTNTTSDYTLTTMIRPIKIAVLDTRNRFHNTSYYYSSGEYSIIVDPTIATPTQTITGTIIPPLGYNLNITLDQILWGYNDGTNFYQLYNIGNTSRPLDYAKARSTLLNRVSSGWYQYDPATHDYTTFIGYTVPDPVTFNIPTSGNKIVTCRIIDSAGHVYDLFATITIESGYVTTKAQATDSITGNLIYGGTIAFWDTTNNSWTNTTPSIANLGQGSIITSANHKFNIYGNATGYTPATIFGADASDVIIYNLVLHPLGNVTAVNTTLYVQVQDDATFNGIQGATVKILKVSDPLYQKLATTPISGTVSFFVPNNTEYWVSVQAWGYQGVSQGISIVDEPAFSLKVKLHRIPVTAQPTPFTVAPTPTATIPGYQPTTGNFTGFWGPFENLFITMGAEAYEVGILMAIAITLVCFFIGAMGPAMAVGSTGFHPLGGEIGAILGMSASVAFGFFPFALSIVVVIGLILYVSLRMWGVTR